MGLQMDGGLTAPPATARVESLMPAMPRVAGMPALNPLPMSEQRIKGVEGCAVGWRLSPLFWRRLVVLGGTVALSGAAIAQMTSVLGVGGLSFVEVVFLAIFSMNFAWIALTFATAVVGAVVRRGRRNGGRGTAPIKGKVAVALPTYNESPDRIFAAVEAMASGVSATGQGRAFDWFVLSDTTAAEIALQEQAAFQEARRRMHGVASIYYRRRLKNVARKPGNISDFCRRWGGSYDYLLVLDADSLMEPATIVELVRRMEADPKAGIVQTVPRLVAGRTLLARLQQFAGRMYGQVIAAGFAWWTGSEGNYWGHNAVIRMKAFTECAGLPTLSGKPPFGGHVLSHDFIEAALMRRAGWSIIVADDLDGSYEEGPSTIAALAARDRRWCQGNLQHVRLLPASGFHWVSRFHLFTGIMSYLASPMWLMLIVAGLAIGVQAHFTRPDYFPDDFHLFPNWPVMDAAGALNLFGLTILILLSVKLIGFIDFVAGALDGGRKRSVVPVFVSVFIEAVMSALLAPILMLIQSALVVSVLTGRDAGWNAQDRDGTGGNLTQLWRDHRVHVMIGALLIGAVWLDPPSLVFWLAPAIVALMLAMPIAAAAGSVRLGRAFGRLGLLTIAEERAVPGVMRDAQALRPVYAAVATDAPDLSRIVSDSVLMNGYVELIDVPTTRQRGEVDAAEAMAAAKVGEARSLAEALSWLKREEQTAVIGAPHLLERLARLPAA